MCPFLSLLLSPSSKPCNQGCHDTTTTCHFEWKCSNAASVVCKTYTPIPFLECITSKFVGLRARLKQHNFCHYPLSHFEKTLGFKRIHARCGSGKSCQDFNCMSLKPRVIPNSFLISCTVLEKTFLFFDLCK